MRGKTCSKNSFIVEMHESGYKSLDVTKYKDCHHTLKKLHVVKKIWWGLRHSAQSNLAFWNILFHGKISMNIKKDMINIQHEL